MRDYTDSDGRAWDVVIGRESWGTLCALFVPRRAERQLPVMQTVLAAEDHAAAEAELAAMNDDEMDALFRRATEKQD